MAERDWTVLRSCSSFEISSFWSVTVETASVNWICRSVQRAVDRKGEVHLLDQATSNSHLLVASLQSCHDMETVVPQNTYFINVYNHPSIERFIPNRKYRIQFVPVWSPRFSFSNMITATTVSS